MRLRNEDSDKPFGHDKKNSQPSGVFSSRYLGGSSRRRSKGSSGQFSIQIIEAGGIIADAF